MAEPTLEFISNEHGRWWEVTYAGMTRRHEQDWQAFIFYEMARAAYAIAQLQQNEDCQ
ncbi:MAG: hypothetical protein ACO3GP_08750 [Candidatus Limnocylindrus sp.]|jgi:hypothetical protein